MSALLAVFVTASAAVAAQPLRANAVFDITIESREGQALGKLKDLVLDLDRGAVRAVVVEKGATLHAHSIAALSPAAESGKLVLDIPYSAANKAPGFERGRWPEFSDPYWARISGPHEVLARASDLIGGAIDDVAFDPRTGAAQAIIEIRSGELEKRVPLSELR
jgi:sporulation protein YlmC with PRC-barrel domain